MHATRSTAVAMLACVAPWTARAADVAREGADKLKGFGLAEGASTPSFGRVMVVFLLLAGLAWASAWLLRRYGARLRISAVNGASPIRAVARSSLPGGVACHLVEVEGNRVLITVSRHGVTSLALGSAMPPGNALPQADAPPGAST